MQLISIEDNVVVKVIYNEEVKVNAIDTRRRFSINLTRAEHLMLTLP